MVDLMEADVRAGHFREHPYPEQARASGVHMLRSAIIDGWIKYADEPDMRARAYIIEVESERAGFALVREPPFETFRRHSPPLVELNMLSVASAFRERGHGSQFLDMLINRHRERQPLFGRCLSASEVMIGMLRRRKFREVWRGEDVRYFLRAGPLTAGMFAKELRAMDRDSEHDG